MIPEPINTLDLRKVSLSPILEFEKVFTMEFTSIFGTQSGFDSASVVQKLIALQARPIDLKLAQLQVKETQFNAFQSLRDELQTFQSALNGTGSINQFNVTSANFTVTGSPTFADFSCAPNF